jgi:uncharacterized protein (DUF3820 family)
MNYIAEYYKKAEDWVIKDDAGKEIFKYSIEEVPVEVVKYFAKTHTKLKEGDSWKELPDHDKFHILDWFEKKVFPTEDFGNFLLKYVIKQMEVDPEGLEDLFAILKNKESEIIISEEEIRLKEEEKAENSIEEEKTEEDKKKVESFFKEYNKKFGLDCCQDLYDDCVMEDEDAIKTVTASIGIISSRAFNRGYYKFLLGVDGGDNRAISYKDIGKLEEHYYKLHSKKLA